MPIAAGRPEETIMGKEDIAAGRIKQRRGKANDIVGAVTGNTGRQLKGKVQKAAGKVQAKLGGAGRVKAKTTTRTRVKV